MTAPDALPLSGGSYAIDGDITAIAEHLQADDTAYEDINIAREQAVNIRNALRDAGYRIEHAASLFAREDAATATLTQAAEREAEWKARAIAAEANAIPKGCVAVCQMCGKNAAWYGPNCEAANCPLTRAKATQEPT